MTRYHFLLISMSILVISACSSTQKSTENSNDPIVGVVNNEVIYFSELIRQFNRTSIKADADVTIDSLSNEIVNFLPLYIDYKAKLASAEQAGYFTDNEILNELNQYETQTAFPYWLENKVTDELLEELVKRSEVELNASHILITIPENTIPADTIITWNKLIEAREKALKGEDFDSLSTIYSSTQMGRSMGGPLGFFSGGWAVKTFEDVAYSLNENEISMPFRSQFGYHIIKLHEIRTSSTDRLLSHVFLRVPSEDELDEVLDQANIGYDEYMNGEIDWANFVQNYSQDAQSGPMEGRIGWVNYGRYDPRFADVVMKIENQGDVTEPFFSGYGVHIVRLDSIKAYPNEDVRRNEILGRLKTLPRYKENKTYTISNIRKAGEESINSEVLDNFEKLIQSNRGNSYSLLNIPYELLNETVYSFNSEIYNLSDYVSWISTNTDTSSTNNYSYSYRDSYFNSVAESHVVTITKDVFPEFKALSTEYLNGLVIFKISEDSVWNYSKSDSASIQALYNQNPDKYRFDNRYFYKRVSAANDSTLGVALQLYQDGVAVDSIRSKVRGVLVRTDIVNDVTIEPFDKLIALNEGDVSDIFDYRNRPTAFILERKENARGMTYDEAYFRVVSEYQPIRENDWMERLRSIFQAESYPSKITLELVQNTLLK